MPIALQDTVEAIAIEAGDIALEYFRTVSGISVLSKGHLDLVTAADQEVERFVAERLHRAFPGDGIFGEEGSFAAGTSSRTWVVDPIDGTFNFVRGGDEWAVSIGLFEGGEPVFGVINAPARAEVLAGGKGVPATLNRAPLPRLHDMVPARAAVGLGFNPSARNGQELEVMRFVMDEARMLFRSSCSAAISLMDIARGRADGYIGIGVASWDVMGILPALQQLGATTTIDWQAAGLATKLDFACGSAGFLKAVSPLMHR